MNVRRHYIICSKIKPTGTVVGDGLVTRSSVPFISVPLYFFVLGLIVFVNHFMTFCKQIQKIFFQMRYHRRTEIAKKSEILKKFNIKTDTTSNRLLQTSGDWLYYGELYTPPTTQLSLVEFLVRR